jgi:hypothetical protein
VFYWIFTNYLKNYVILKLKILKDFKKFNIFNGSFRFEYLNSYTAGLWVSSYNPVKERGRLL